MPQVDLNDPTRNMFGLLPCPKCGAAHRYPTQAVHPKYPNVIMCDDCGHTEPREEEQQQDFLEAVNESSLTPEQKDEWFRVCLWEAINEYAAACDGDTSDKTVSNRRIDAVAQVERVVRQGRQSCQAQ